MTDLQERKIESYDDLTLQDQLEMALQQLESTKTWIRSLREQIKLESQIKKGQPVKYTTPATYANNVYLLKVEEPSFGEVKCEGYNFNSNTRNKNFDGVYKIEKLSISRQNSNIYVRRAGNV